MSARICELLEREPGYVPVGALATALQTTDRNLRGKHGELGTLDIASQEIFEERGLLLVTSMRQPSGVRLTKDPEEIRAALQQWRDWFWPIKAHKIDHYERALRAIESKQMELPIVNREPFPPKGVGTQKTRNRKT